MPIVYDKEEGWVLKDPTPQEINSLIEIGKAMIVEGQSHAYTNERYKNFLLKTAPHHFFES